MESIRTREARVEDSSGIAQVHIGSWRSTYRGLIPQSYLDGLDEVARGERWIEILGRGNPLESTRVALEENRIIGFTSIGPIREPQWPFEGELYALYLDDSHQKRGIGKRLFDEALDAMKKRGFRSMVVWVLRENPTCGFYEKMGGRYLGDKIEAIGGEEVVEVAYGWDALPE